MHQSAYTPEVAHPRQFAPTIIHTTSPSSVMQYPTEMLNCWFPHGHVASPTSAVLQCSSLSPMNSARLQIVQMRCTTPSSSLHRMKKTYPPQLEHRDCLTVVTGSVVPPPNCRMYASSDALFSAVGSAMVANLIDRFREAEFETWRENQVTHAHDLFVRFSVRCHDEPHFNSRLSQPTSR